MNKLISIYIIYLIFMILTTVKQRHDFIKYITNDLDDKVVKLGIISDETLHKLGNMLGLCGRRPGDI